MAGISNDTGARLREENHLLEKLHVFFGVLLNEPSKIVDDTHLSKVIDGLIHCDEEKNGFLISLLDKPVLHFVSFLVQCLSSEVERTQVFAIQLVGLFARNSDAFRHLNMFLHSHGGRCEEAGWWAEVLQSGSTSVQYAVLSVLELLLGHNCGSEWMGGSELFSCSIHCLESSSFFVTKASINFLASSIVQWVLLAGEEEMKLHKKTLSNFLQTVNKALLSKDNGYDGVLFQHALTLVTRVFTLVVDTGKLNIDNFLSVFPSLLEVSLQLKWRTGQRNCQLILNLLKSTPQNLFVKMLPSSSSEEDLMASIVSIIEHLISRKSHSVVFSFVDTIVTGESARFLKSYFVQFLLEVVLLTLSIASGHPFTSTKLPDTVATSVRSNVLSDVTFTSIAVGHLKTFTQGPTSQVFFDKMMRGKIAEFSCQLLIELVGSIVGEFPALSHKHAFGESPNPLIITMATSVQKELLIQDLLSVATSCVVVECTSVDGRKAPVVTNLQSLCDIITNIVQHMNVFTTRVVCCTLKCLSCVVSRVVLDDAGLDSATQQPSVFLVPALPMLLQSCMQSDNWEVKDSCLELLQDIYKLSFQSGERTLSKKPVAKLLGECDAHKLVLHSLGEEDGNVRATAVNILSLLGQEKGMFVQFCDTNGLGEVDLFQVVTDLSVTDESPIVRASSWDCITHWHHGPVPEGPLVAPSSAVCMKQLNSACLNSLLDEDQEVRIAAVRAVKEVVLSGIQNIISDKDSLDSYGCLCELDLQSFFVRDHEEDERVLSHLYSSAQTLLAMMGDDDSLFSTVHGLLSCAVSSLQSLLHTRYCTSACAQLVSVLEEIITAAVATDSKFTEADCY